MKEQETTTTDFYIKGALYMYNSFEREYLAHPPIKILNGPLYCGILD